MLRKCPTEIKRPTLVIERVFSYWCVSHISSMWRIHRLLKTLEECARAAPSRPPKEEGPHCNQSVFFDTEESQLDGAQGLSMQKRMDGHTLNGKALVWEGFARTPKPAPNLPRRKKRPRLQPEGFFCRQEKFVVL